MVCPHCGFDNPSASAYCARCQRPLESAAPRPHVMPSATDVAKAIMQRRAQEPQPAIHEERTVVQRAPLAPSSPPAAPASPPQAAPRAAPLPPPRQMVQPTPAQQTPAQHIPAQQIPAQQPVAQQPAAQQPSTQQPSAQPQAPRPVAQPEARPAVPVQPTPAQASPSQAPAAQASAAQAPAPAPRPVQAAPTPPVQPRPPAETQPAAAAPRASVSPFTSPFDDGDERDEPTAIFKQPTFDNRPETTQTNIVPGRPVEPMQSVIRPPDPTVSAEPTRVVAKPAAAPALPMPPPASSPLTSSAVREPTPPRDAATREAVQRVQARNAALQAPLRTEPGVPASVLRQGATPPQRPAPRPPGAAQPSPFMPPPGWRLLLAHAVDAALLLAFFMLFAFIDGSLSSSHGASASAFEWLANHPGSAFRAGIVTILAGTTYHLMLDLAGGRTLGRIVSGTALARRSGKPLNWFVVVLRTVFSYVSLLVFGAGFFWAIVDRRGRCLHDLIAGTVVIRHRA